MQCLTYTVIQMTINQTVGNSHFLLLHSPFQYTRYCRKYEYFYSNRQNFGNCWILCITAYIRGTYIVAVNYEQPADSGPRLWVPLTCNYDHSGYMQRYSVIHHKLARLWDFTCNNKTEPDFTISPPSPISGNYSGLGWRFEILIYQGYVPKVLFHFQHPVRWRHPSVEREMVWL